MLDREAIYEQLREQIPYLQRRCCTPRVMRESGVDFLLDQLNGINQMVDTELLSILEDENDTVREA